MIQKIFVSVCVMALIGFGTANASVIVNPSFENSLSGWSIGGTANFGAGVAGFDTNSLETDGINFGRIWSYNIDGTVFNSGDYKSVWQSVDLTNVESITFDATLEQWRYTVDQNRWVDWLEASFIVDDISLWSSSVNGDHLGVLIDVSSLSGYHNIGFQNAATAYHVESDRRSNWFAFDNLRVTTNTTPVPEPSTFLLLGGGLTGLAFLARRRKKE